jgi:putative transposase
MPRKKLIRAFDLPYHLAVRANNREEFPGELAYVWKVFTSELYVQQILYGVRLHAFVLMPNHFHLLATSPNRGIDQVMKEVLGSSTRILNMRCQRSGHIFGGRYFWSLIREPDYYAHALKYVLRNPVKAGLCAQVAEYPFSTYSGLVGVVPFPIAIVPPFGPLERLVPMDVEAVDAWLNCAHGLGQNEAIKNALRRKEFKFSPARSSRKPSSFSV